MVGLPGWRGRLLAAMLAGAGLLGLDAALRAPPLPVAHGQWPATAGAPPAAQAPLRLQASGMLPMPPDTPAAHASSLVPLPPGGSDALLAFWFAGSRESAPDVQIAASAYSRADQQWRPARFVVDRRIGWGRLGFGLRRLGNPVAWRDAEGRIHLFVVATGLGGWAAGRILHLRQPVAGQDFERLSFEPVGVLPLSWLWNTSHLVRAMPLPLADGGMVLPVYFELGRKYPVALRFDAQGRLAGLVRMSRRGDLLQPTLLMRSETDWLALMRDSSAQRRVRAADTVDGGRHWRDLPDADLPNPDASLVGLGLQPGLLLLAHNPRQEGRAELDLSLSTDGGQHWRVVQTLAQGPAGSEFSYPAMAWADGALWLSYTDQRRAIAWRRFVFDGERPH